MRIIHFCSSYKIFQLCIFFKCAQAPMKWQWTSTEIKMNQSFFEYLFSHKVTCLYFLLIFCQICFAVVYFNQHLGAAHSERWLKYVFLTYFVPKKLKKGKKRNKIAQMLVAIYNTLHLESSVFLFIKIEPFFKHHFSNSPMVTRKEEHSFRFDSMK